MGRPHWVDASKVRFYRRRAQRHNTVATLLSFGLHLLLEVMEHHSTTIGSYNSWMCCGSPAKRKSSKTSATKTSIVPDSEDRANICRTLGDLKKSIVVKPYFRDNLPDSAGCNDTMRRCSTRTHVLNINSPTSGFIAYVGHLGNQRPLAVFTVSESYST